VSRTNVDLPTQTVEKKISRKPVPEFEPGTGGFIRYSGIKNSTVLLLFVDSIIIVPMNPQSSFWSCLLSVHVLQTVPDRKGCGWKLVTPHNPMDIPPPPPNISSVSNV
jgi:hypothetical protein